MRFAKIAAFLLTVALITGNALAQDNVIARAYRTVNVRSGPGTQYDIIGQLNSGNEVHITGRSDDESDWLRVDFQGSDGWLAYFTVTVLGDLDQLPLVSPLDDQESTPVHIVTPITLQATSSVFVTTYRRVNVRSGPGSEYLSVGNLEAGSTADVTGRSNDNEWLRIDFGDTSGWVAFFVVSLTGSLDNIEIVEVSAEALTEEPQNTLEMVTRYNTNLHEQPTLDSPILDIIPFNTPLQIDERSDEAGSWLHVSYNDHEGWLLRALASITGDLADLSIESPIQSSN
jgi:uncharacterized protein YraI